LADRFTFAQRLAAKDIDNWEQKRVDRLKGESDGVL
jgi:cytochrome c oxidase assembly protein subunit 16